MLKEMDSEVIISMQTTIINDHISYRQRIGWEKQAQAVELSYKGNKFPIYTPGTTDESRRITGTTWYSNWGRSSDKISYLNLIKRQHRVLANYLRNNEPKYLITDDPFNYKEDPNDTVTDNDMTAARSLLDNIFGRKWTTQSDKTAPFVSSFFDTIMNDNIDWGLLRWYALTLCWFDKDAHKVKFKLFDPFDVYYRLNVRRLTEAREVLFTYTKTTSEMIAEFPKDADGNEINWKEKPFTTYRSDSPYKPITILEPDNKEIFLLREGWYEDWDEITEEKGDRNVIFPNKEPVVYRIISTRDKLLFKEKIEWLSFVPKVIFAPLAMPDELLPRSWYADMVNLEIEANRVFQKLVTIVHTQGTRIYVRKWTKITKAVGKVFNELWLEVYEVDWSQTLPQQAQMANFTQDMINFLNLALQHIEQEWGILWEMMGSGSDDSNGQDQSWRAIMALQAWSKNNVWMILDALNQYMTHISQLVMKLYEIYGEEIEKVYSEDSVLGQKGNFDLHTKKLAWMNVKVSVTPKSAWDEITQQATTMSFLDTLNKFNPDIKITPDILASIMSITNDHIPKITQNLEKSADPDVQIADWENKKFLAGDHLNANQADNHQTHMAIHSTMLKALDPKNPIAQAIILHMKQHEGNMQPPPPSPWQIWQGQPAPQQQPMAQAPQGWSTI